MTAAMERDAMRYNMFEGEDLRVRVLKDAFLGTRKAHQCVICQGIIPPHSRVRARTELNLEDHRVMTFYACEPCCEAMAEAVNGNDKPICDRTAAGIVLARAIDRGVQ